MRQCRIAVKVILSSRGAPGTAKDAVSSPFRQKDWKGWSVLAGTAYLSGLSVQSALSAMDWTG
jgi:hypothetical protein